jgi:hypothetical protein
MASSLPPCIIRIRRSVTGCPATEKPSEILLRLNETLLSQLRRDDETVIWSTRSPRLRNNAQAARSRHRLAVSATGAWSAWLGERVAADRAGRDGAAVCDPKNKQVCSARVPHRIHDAVENSASEPPKENSSSDERSLELLTAVWCAVGADGTDQ